MDRISFLEALPFLHRVPSTSPSTIETPIETTTKKRTTSLLKPLLQQHQQLIHAVTATNYDYNSSSSNNKIVDDNYVISNNKATTKEAQIGNDDDVEGVQQFFTNKQHVVSFEPIDYYNNRSTGPAFFSSSKKKRNNRNKEEKESSTEQGNDPSLCNFKAVLFPTKLEQSISGSSSSYYDGNPNLWGHDPVQLQDSDLPLPTSSLPTSNNNSSSVSTFMTSSAKQDEEGWNNHHPCATSYMLYFWFDNNVFCVDHDQIRSIHVEPPSPSSSMQLTNNMIEAQNTPGHHEQRIVDQQKQGETNQNDYKSYTTSPMKPPSLVISFDSCSFRIFELPPLSSSSSLPSAVSTPTVAMPSLCMREKQPSHHLHSSSGNGSSGGDLAEEKKEIYQQYFDNYDEAEKYLESTFTKLRFFLSSSSSSLSLFDINANKNHNISFKECIRRCYSHHFNNNVPLQPPQQQVQDSLDVSSNSSTMIRHDANGQAHTDPVVEKLLLDRSFTCGAEEETVTVDGAVGKEGNKSKVSLDKINESGGSIRTNTNVISDNGCDVVMAGNGEEKGGVKDVNQSQTNGGDFACDHDDSGSGVSSLPNKLDDKRGRVESCGNDDAIGNKSKNDGDEERIYFDEMKKKRDSYQKSWFALQHIHSIVNPNKKRGRMGQQQLQQMGEEEDATNNIPLMMTKCAQELSKSYYEDITTAAKCQSAVDEEGRTPSLPLPSFPTPVVNGEILKNNLSKTQKDLDDAIARIFSVPKKSGFAVTTDGRMGASSVVSNNGNTNVRDRGLDDENVSFNDLKEGMEECLHRYREIVRTRHSLAFLPSRFKEDLM